jgi:hypothetical protein
MSRKHSSVLAVALVSVSVAALGTGGTAMAAKSFSVALSGKSEVPKAGNGRGTARLTLDEKTGRVCFRMKLQNVGQTLMGHIHKGGPGAAGPIVQPLYTKPTTQPKGCVNARTSLVTAIERNPSQYYVNVHTKKYPAGAARGQLR